MKNKKQKNNKGPLIFIAIFVSVIVISLLIKVYYVPMKTYHSKFLKITIDYPARYELEEKFGTITIKDKDIDGLIMIDSIGTNSSSLTYNNSDQRIVINGLEAKKFVSKYADYPNSLKVEHKGYQFYKNYVFYSVYTNTPIFYSDLDKIARSFRYEP